ncbi:MAG: hypothetical protein ACLU31_04220, partial [Ezakiella sp.]
MSGIKAVYYLYETDDKENPIKIEWTDKETDGSYKIENCEKDEGAVFVLDWAGNLIKLDLSEKGQNKIVINRTSEGVEDPGSEIAVFDENGKKMTNLNALEDGKYTVEALNVPEGVNVEINPTEITFGEDGETEKEVNVKFNKVSKDELDEYGTLKVNVVDSDTVWSGFTLYAVDNSGKKYELYSKFDWGSETYGAKLPAGEYTILVLDSNGKEINYSGNKNVVVNKQDTSWGRIRFLRYGELEVSIWSEVPELINKIKDLGKPTEWENEYSFNAKDVFKIYDTATGKDLFEGQDYYEAYFKPWDNGEKIDFWIPADGDYTVELINDSREYLVEPTRVDAKVFTRQKDEEHKWAFIDVYKPKADTAKLTIKEELVSGESSTEPIKAVYHLYDDYGKEIEPTGDKVWENLQAKFYTLEVESLSDKLVPEKKVYNIDAFNNLNVEQVVRWKDISTDPVERYTSLIIGIYGEYDKDNRDIQALLKNKNTQEEIVINAEAGTKVSEELVPIGTYEVILTLPDDTIIDDIFLSVDEYAGSKEKLVALGSKFEATFTTAFNEVEINLKKQKRDFGEINVVSSGLQDKIVSYKLIGEDVALESNDGIFKNLEPGNYTLTFDVPEGYEVESNEIDVTVEEGKVNTIYINFNKKIEDNVETHKASIKT